MQTISNPIKKFPKFEVCGDLIGQRSFRLRHDAIPRIRLSCFVSCFAFSVRNSQKISG
jgi:hypothetical protein